MNKKAVNVIVFSVIALIAVIITVSVINGTFPTEACSEFSPVLSTVVPMIAVGLVMTLFYPNFNKNNSKTAEQIENSRSLVLLISAIIGTVGLIALGALLGAYLPAGLAAVSGFIALAIVGGLIIIYVALAIAAYLIGKKASATKVADQNAKLTAILEDRKAAAAFYGKRLNLIVTLSRVATLLIALVGLICALLAGVSVKNGSEFGAPLGIISGSLAYAILAGALSHITPPIPRKILSQSNGYVPKSDYPVLYSIAERAEREIGCKGEIRIALTDDFNAGIAQFGNVYSLQLGVIALAFLTEEELYAIILHEFAHCAAENESHNRLWKYGNSIKVRDGRPAAIFVAPVNIFFDMIFTLDNFYYGYAVSVDNEERSDAAMLRCGDPRAVASGLIKMKYYELFDWESYGRNFDNYYAPEEQIKNAVSETIRKFGESIEGSTDKWNKLIDVEIISRNATHSTIKMRLEKLGIKDHPVDMPTKDGEYAEEGRRALEFVEKMIYDGTRSTYNKNRKERYLDNIKKIEEWEAAGSPVTNDGYADVIGTLMVLGRIDDVMALCDRVLDELEPPTDYYARFTKGCALLHRFDSAGIELVYRAMDDNHNVFEEGMDIIGTFCCLTGMEEELENYRAKADGMTQEYIDKYDKVGELNKNDKLSAENLPDGMLDEILGFIKANDPGVVENIYLVRKTVTDDFFSSAFVVKFTKNADKDAAYELMHKIFELLDKNYDWQFSLFEYSDVAKVGVENIPGSCVYTKN